MNDRVSNSLQPWLKLDRVVNLVQLEPFFLILGLVAAAWIIYKTLLKEVSAERHINLQKLFKNLFFHLSVTSAWLATFLTLLWLGDTLNIHGPISRVATYLGLLALIWGALCFVKVWRILAFEYLFLGHMKVGVPLLIVNLVSLVLTLAIGLWFSTEVVGLQLAPVLAGSAIVSVVLGLAMQDTLGNLFAGVALQFDKPFELGDWIEVQNGPMKWVGQVDEISWRATVLIGLSDELITIPNRVIGSAQISNFNLRRKPICRSQSFRLPLTTEPKLARETLLSALKGMTDIRRFPEPLVLLLETTENWAVYKLVYFIEDYGAQWAIGDRVLERALGALKAANVTIAPPRLALLNETREASQ